MRSLLSKKRKKNSSSNKEKVKETPRESVYFDEELEPVEVEMVPEDQLELTQAELDEEFTKTLTSLDPNKPSKITNFNFKSGQFESKPNDQHIAIHFKHDGIIWSKKEKEELERLQQEKEKEEQEENEKKDADENENGDEDQKAENTENPEENAATETAGKDGDETDKDKETENNENQDEDAKDASEAEEDSEETEKKTKKKKELLVKNQFNFSDRASQTFNEPLRDREIQTEPAPKSVFSQNANPFSIRDEYLNNLLKLKQQQLEEENKKKAKSAFGGGTSSENKDEDGEDDNNDNHKKHKIKHNDEGDALLHSAQMLKALKIMERVTVLNANSDSYHDFRYYKPSDYKRGSFVNKLWTFNHNDGKDQQRMVTCLEWNKLHLDLFAVGYGSYNFNFQTSGMICIYSLKSTVYPEKIILCESGVMSMSFHPKYSSLLCVGHYDGSVAVYDIRNRDDSPIYSSQNPESHHSDPVWDIKWYNDELQHELMFYSISSDSEIKFWKMSQNELNHEVLIKLTTPPITITQSMEPITTEDPNKGKNKNEDNDKDDNRDEKALCSCFDFNPKMEHLYLVGTEDGHIMECNKTYNDGYTKIYVNAHYMNVYCIKWNPFHDKIFLSCSEDWTIKLWEIDNNTKNDKDKLKFDAEPIITYDLGNSINDIAWSPYSSTIFAAVTSDGKVHLFDLSQNKNSPLCSTTIVANDNNDNCKLTKVAFPIGFPLIIVGDEKGNVYALKLSPNLYLDKVKHRDILKQGISPEMFSNNIDFKNKEKDKLINVLNVTGNKVFDIIQHFSPQKKPMKKK